MQRSLLAVAAAFFLAACVSKVPFVPPELDSAPRVFTFEQGGTFLQLANGLRALVLPDERTNLVRVDVRYGLGSVDDPEGKAGLAHLTEHMLFEVRKGGSRGPTIGDRLSERTIENNAYTSRDETHYLASAPALELERLLKIEAERMATTCDQIDQDAFERELLAVINERRQRGALALRILLDRQWYGDEHPYGQPYTASEEELASLTRDDVCGLLRDYYGPQNAIVVVSGAVQLPTVKMVLEQQFGPLRRRQTRPRSAIPLLHFSGQSTTHRAPIETAVAVIAYPAPVFTDQESTYTDLLQLFFSLELQGRFAELDFVEAFAMTRSGYRRSPMYVALIEAKNEADLDRAIEEFFARRKNLLPRLFNATVIEAVREARTAALLASAEPLDSRPLVFANMAQYARHKGFLSQEIEDVRAVTSAALAVRAGAFFAAESSRITKILPSGESSAETARTIDQQSIEFDLPEWRSPVDATEARRPAKLAHLAAGPPVQSYQLDNGLRVMLVPTLAFPLVNMRLVFPVGRRHAPVELPGLSELSARLLQFDYERRYMGEDIEAINEIYRAGGFDGARVYDSATVFSIRGLSIHADRLLWQLFWQVHGGDYDDEVLDSWKERLRDRETPQPATLDRLVRALFGPEHPYSRSPWQTEQLESVNVGRLRRFRDRNYRSEGASLVVAGNFDPAVLKPRIQRLFSKIASGAAPTANAPGGPQIRPQTVLVAASTEKQPKVAFGFATEGGTSTAARAVMVELVSQRMWSLREKLGATYGAQVSHSEGDGPGMLAVSVAIAPERVSQTLQAALAVFDRLRSSDNLDADFVRARRAVLRKRLARAADSESVATLLADVAVRNAAVDDYEQRARAVAEVTVDQVRDLIATELAADKAAIVAEGPEELMKEAFGDAGLAVK